MIWRRLRGILGVALLWAVAWLPLGLLLGLYSYWREGPMDFDASWPPGHFFSHVGWFLAFWATAGAISGALFALVLAIAERHRTLRDLSTRRMALWGALGSVLVPAVLLAITARDFVYSGWWQESALTLLLAGGLGAGTAAVTLRLANGKEPPQIGAS
jgi:hypothetical protein